MWTFSGESKRKIGHPTPFYVELPKRCIKLFSYVGDIVLDSFMGFRVIIVIEANSYVNIRSSRLLPKFKTQKINSWCAA
nr:DNA methyltransferase [uncultured Fenollaria sp.]